MEQAIVPPNKVLGMQIPVTLPSHFDAFREFLQLVYLQAGPLYTLSSEIGMNLNYRPWKGHLTLVQGGVRLSHLLQPRCEAK
jgi:hypothetical protein